MNEQVFWDLIDQSRSTINLNFETQCVNITELLLSFSSEDIIQFEYLLRQQIERANKWNIMAASFVVCSFISDDTYEDFRAWLVGQGKDNFEKVLKNPNHICNLIKPGQVKEMGGEHMLFVAINAYLEKNDVQGEEEELKFYDLIPIVAEQEVKQAWPESKNEFRKMFPQLFDTFWNEDRIKEKLEEAESQDMD